MLTKKYIYNESTYFSEDAVRRAISENENKAFGVPETAEEWLELGVEYIEENAPDPEPTQEEIVRQYKNAIQDYMDETARLPQYDYDDLKSACDYRDSSNPKFRAEGIGFYNWRDAVWTYGLEQLNKAISGEIPIPTVEAFIQSLPELQIDYGD